MSEDEATVEIAGSEIRLTQFSDYEQVLLAVFAEHYEEGDEEIEFEKDEFADAADDLGLRIRNIPDVVYAFRSRRPLPDPITTIGDWIIQPAGKGSYKFQLLQSAPQFDLNFEAYQPIEIYNSVPEVVQKFLRDDEQSLLTTILYNRVIDIFTGLTCFHIQNHYRASVPGTGQVELDSFYVGVDDKGELYAIPIEAKGAAESEKIGRVQVAHMSELAQQDFPNLDRRILAIKELEDGTICAVEFSEGDSPDDYKVRQVRRFDLIREDRTRP
ncbi:hypothetical protein BRD56_00605 [Thermoplasmatales archaeon SW_10_69_26]|nr:MAG: hypothetical protein BRD56_00605 [Thermoplasmatales archaeon SW_10_69_26]